MARSLAPANLCRFSIFVSLASGGCAGYEAHFGRAFVTSDDPVCMCVCRSHAVLELFSQEDLSVTDLQTVVLRNNLAEMLESGVLGLVNTFCLNPGTSLQVTTKRRCAACRCLHHLGLLVISPFAFSWGGWGHSRASCACTLVLNTDGRLSITQPSSL